jgi:hypothetical protein
MTRIPATVGGNLKVHFKNTKISMKNFRVLEVNFEVNKTD